MSCLPRMLHFSVGGEYVHIVGVSAVLVTDANGGLVTFDSPLAEGEPLAKHLAAVVAAINPPDTVLRQWILVTLHANLPQNGFSIPADVLGTLAEIGLDLEITILA